MNLNRLRVCEEADMRLRHLKARTGLTPNVLCRLGFCLSLRDPTSPDPDLYPEDGPREINRWTLTGQWDSLFVALLKERCAQDGFTETDHEAQFRAHINRGILQLYKQVHSLEDLVRLIPQTSDVPLENVSSVSPTSKGVLLKESTRAYYEGHAKDYFDQTHSIDLQPLWTKLSQHLHPEATILDLGCGSGRDVHHFRDTGLHAIGLDYSFNLLRLAKTFTGQTFTQADFRFPPFKDHNFDAVWAVASLLHVHRRSLPSVLAEIHRILRKGALLITSVKKGSGEKVDSDGRYDVLYLPDEWGYILRDSAFEVLELEENEEIRETSGVRENIIWIVCLAKAI